MTQNPTLLRLLRKLLRYGSTARAARIVERLTPQELTGMFPLLSRTERCQLVDLLLCSPCLDSLPALQPELVDEALFGIPDQRLQGYLERLAPSQAALIVSRLAEPRRRQVQDGLEPTRRAEVERCLGEGARSRHGASPATTGSAQGPGLRLLRRRLAALMWW